MPGKAESDASHIAMRKLMIFLTKNEVYRIYLNGRFYIFIYIFALLACRLNTFFIYCTRFPSNLFDTFFSLITSKKDTIRQIRKLFRKMLSDVF